MTPFCMSSAVPGLVYACSGGSILGELADRAARQLHQNRTALMGSLAGIAAGQGGPPATAQAAIRILVIDGCERDCARHCLEGAGLCPVLHLRVSEVRGVGTASESCEAGTRRVAEAARRLLLVHVFGI